MHIIAELLDSAHAVSMRARARATRGRTVRRIVTRRPCDTPSAHSLRLKCEQCMLSPQPAHLYPARSQQTPPLSVPAGVQEGLNPRSWRTAKEPLVAAIEPLRQADRRGREAEPAEFRIEEYMLRAVRQGVVPSGVAGQRGGAAECCAVGHGRLVIGVRGEDRAAVGHVPAAPRIDKPRAGLHTTFSHSASGRRQGLRLTLSGSTSKRLDRKSRPSTNSGWLCPTALPLVSAAATSATIEEINSAPPDTFHGSAFPSL